MRALRAGAGSEGLFTMPVTALADSVSAIDDERQAGSAVRVLEQFGLVEPTVLGGDPQYDGRTVRAHGCWVEELVRNGVRHQWGPTDAETARLLWVMQSVRVRDAAWSLITAATASAHERWWNAILADLSDAEARSQNVGGEVLAEVF